MDQVLNAKERMQAFWRFLLFFVISLVAVFLAVFFYYQVPKKKNAILMDKAELFQRHTTSEEKFTAAMVEASALIDSMDKPGANVAYLNNLIGNKLGELTILKNDVNASRQQQVFLDIIIRYQDAKSTLVKSKDKLNNLQDLQTKLNNCQAENTQLNNTLEQYKRVNNSNY